MSRSRILLLFLAALPATPANAFKNNQHKTASALAVDKAGSIAPDIKKFKSLIVGWSFGINYSDFGFFGKPAEQLAHVGDQTRPIGTVFNNNGAFSEYLGRAREEYALRNFSSEAHLDEGAYVWTGTCLHLIEDQASFPHAANVLHQQNDRFEGPLFPQRVEVDFTGTQGLVAPGQAYFQSLLATKAKIPGVIPPSPMSPKFNAYWVMNEQLRAAGDESKSLTPYNGQYNSATEGVDSAFTGAYGGPSGEDIFSHDLESGKYREQGIQATDFAFNFLLRLSKSLPPIFSNLSFCESYNSDGICSFERALGPGRLNSTNGTDIVLVIAENRTKRVFVDAFVRQGQSEIPLVTTGATVVLGKEDSPLAIPQSRTLEGGLAWAGLPIDLHPTSDSNLNLLPFKAEIRLPFHGLVHGATLTEGSHEFCVRVRDVDGNASEERCGNFILDNTPPSWLSCNSAVASTDGKYDVDARDSLTGVKSIDVETADGQRTTSGPSEPAAAVTQAIGPLASGKHRLTLRDAVGNSADCHLEVERNPVRIQVARSGQIIADTLAGLARSASPIPASGEFSFAAQSVLGPISQLEVLRGGSPVIDKGPASPDADSIVATLPPGEPAGVFIVRAKDAAGRSVETTFTTVNSPFRVIREESVADFDPISRKFKPQLVFEAESISGLSHIGLRDLTSGNTQVEIDRKAVSGTTARATFGPLDPEKTYLAVAETAAGDLFTLRLSFFTNSNGSGAGQAPYHWNIPVVAAGATLTNTVRFANPPTGSVNVPCTSATEQCVKLAAAGEGFSAEGTFVTGVKEIQSPIESETRLLLGGALTIRQPGADGSGFCSHFAGHTEPYAVDYLGDMVSGTSACVTSGPTSSLKIRTGDSAANLGAEVPLVTERYDFQPGWITSVSDGVVNYWRSFLQTRECPGTEVIPLRRYVQAEFRLTHSPNASRLCGRADDPPSDSPVVGSRAGKYGLVVPHFGFVPDANWLFVDIDPSPAIAPQLLVRTGPSAHVPIPGVGDFDFSGVTSPGSLSAIPGPVRVPPGYSSKQANSGTHVDSDAVYDAIDITLPFDPAVYHPSQLEKLVILHITNEVTGAYQDITTARGPSYIKGRTTSLSPFIIALPTAALAVPIESGRLVQARPEATITASNEGLTLVEVDTATAEAVTFLAAKSAEGYSLVGTAYRTNPPSVALLGDARLLMRYSTATILEANLDPASALIANFELGTSSFELPPQASDTVEAAISLHLGSAVGAYGVFARPRDRQAPATRLATRGPFFRDAAGRLFVSTSALLGFEGADSGTLVGLPSGYRRTYFKVEPSPSLVAGGLSAGTAHLFEVFADSIALGGGSRTIAFGGVDFAGNFEPLQVVDVFVDFTPPTSLLLIDDAPAPFQSGTLPILRSSAVAFAVADPGAPAAGPGGLEYSLDDGTWANFEEPVGGLSTGTHVLRFRAVDLVENREEIREVTLDVRPFADTTPPITRVVAVGARFLAADGREFLSTDTLLNLKAYDSYGREGPPSGVAEVLYSVEGASETNGEVRYSQPFSLPEGASLLRFGARDTAGNAEIFGSSAVLVDGTPPLSVPLITGSSTTNSTGNPIVGLDTILAIESTDTISNGVSAGLAATLFLLDPPADFCGLSTGILPVAVSTAPQGSCANPYFVAPATLSPGERHIAFLPVDNVGNLGILSTAVLHVDADGPSPVTDLAPVTADETTLTVSWTAPDDAVAGVAAYELRIATRVFDETNFHILSSVRDPPTAAAPGALLTTVFDGLEIGATYYIAVRSRDRVGNNSGLGVVLRTSTRGVPLPPPLTGISLIRKTTPQGFPKAVTADSQGNLFVVYGTKIAKYGPEGQLLMTWDSLSRGGGEVFGYSAARLGPDGRLHLLTAGMLNGSFAWFVQVFGPDGTFVRNFGAGLNAPKALDFDSVENLWIYDSGLGKLVVLSQQDTVLRRIDVGAATPSTARGGMAIDAADNVFVAHSSDRRIYRFSSDGSLAASFLALGTGNGAQRAEAMDIDIGGRLHVADTDGASVVVYSPQGAVLARYGTAAVTPGAVMEFPSDVFISTAKGKAWVADQASKPAVYEFALSSSPLLVPEIISPPPGARIAALDPLIVGMASNGSRIEALEGGIVVGSTIVTRQDGTFFLRPQLSIGSHQLSIRGASSLGIGSEAVELPLVVESTGAIQFEPPVLKRFPAWSWQNISATTTVTADFNGDGKLDIFAIGDRGYVVLLGDGGGGFTQVGPVLGPLDANGFPTTALFETITRAFAGDFNRDGKQDVVVSKTLGGVLLYAGQGDGTFQRQADLSFTLPIAMALSDMTTGDFNGDGVPDLMMGSWGSVQLALGNGNFTFALRPHVALPGSGQPLFLIVQAGDFNLDGKLDVVNDGTVIFGDGAGGLSGPAVLCAVCETPQVGDFNGDARPDVAMRVRNFLNQSQNGLQVFLGRGDGRFVGLPLQVDSNFPWGGLVGRPLPDFNADGRGDVAYADNIGVVRLFQSRGDGVLGPQQNVSVGSGCQLETLSHGDLNGDGSDDLVAPLNFTSCSFDDISILFNKRDTVAPGTVTELAATSPPEGEVLLSWTAPGDNGAAGQATTYDLKFAFAPIDSLPAFEGATALSATVPRRGGQREALTLSGLPAGTELFFALRTRDEAGNTSGLSNGASVTPLFSARGAAGELLVTAREVQPALTQVSTQSAQGLVMLASAAPQALALVSAFYEIGPADPVLPSTANALWTYTPAQLTAANVTAGEIALYRFEADAGWVRVSSQTLDTAQRRVSASLTRLGAAHALFGVIHDLATPETALHTEGGAQFFASGTGGIYYSSQTAFALSAFDPISRSTASGVALTEFRVDPASPEASFETYVTTFSLSEGSRRIEYRSRDFAQNLEPVKSSSVFVDATPPLAAFEVLSASSAVGEGLQFHAQARVAITASDPPLAGPAAAPGSGVKAVFLLIDRSPQDCGFPADAILPASTSTGAPQGSCENPRYIEPFSLSVGSHVLFTQALDNVANRGELRTLSASVTPALAPDPRELPFFEFLSKFGSSGAGNGGLSSRITDIEIAEDGSVFVADAFNALVQVFDSSGAFVRQWGGVGTGPGKFAFLFLGSTGLSLNRTPNGTLWVADGFRLQEFSRDGQYLSEMNFSGFNPVDVAMDGIGRMYVSGALPSSGGTRVWQVRVFDSGRNLLASWPTGDTHGTLNSDSQIAVDSNYQVHVLAPNQSLVRRFDLSGNLLGTVGSPGDADGHFNAPRGIALDVHDNLYVSDYKYNVFRGRVQVFTSTGAFVASFGPVAKSSAGYIRVGDDGLGVDRRTGVVYVADSADSAGTIKRFAPDLTAPAPPVVESPAAGPALGAEAPLIVGQAEGTSRVELREGAATLATAGVDATTGRFIISSYQTPLGLGAHSLSLLQIDPAGHVSEAAPLSLAVSAPVSLTLSSRAAVSTVVPGDGFSVGQTPRLAAGDFDSDGLPDLVTFLSIGHAFAKGAGDGTFTMNKMDFTFGLSNDQEDLAVADFDLDGKLDVLVARRSALVFLKGAGNGTFPNRTTLSLGTDSSRRMAVADFNGDGFLDAAVIPFPFSSVGPKVYFGGAGGAFSPGPALVDRASQGRALLAADLNGDGAADIFAGARIYLGSGAGTFPTTVALPLVGSKYTLDAAALDMNGDGHKDLVVTQDEGLYTVLNLSGGWMNVENGIVGMDSLAVADADQDGRADLWAMPPSFSGLPRVKILMNLGDGHAGRAVDFQFPGTSDRSQLVPRAVVADFDDDGVLDAAMPYIASNQLTAAAALMNRTDLLPPAPITDLSARVTLDGAVSLHWTAPGDDGVRGRAAAYQLRYNVGPITDFEAAFPLTLPAPLLAGSPETAELTGLPGGKSLHFALRAVDDAGLVGAISNEVSTATVFVAKATNPVNGLPELVFTSFNTQPSVTEIGTASATGAVVLAAASGASLYLVGRIYEVGPEGFNFNPPAQIAIRYSTETLAALGIAETDLKIYEYDPVRGLFELPSQTLDVENRLVYAPLEVLASIFGLYFKVTDRTPPSTALRLDGGATYLGQAGELYVSSPTLHVLEATDPIVLGTASGVAYSEYRVDPATTGPAFTAYSGPFGLAEGLRTLEYRSADHAGNMEVARATTVRVDATAPATAISAGVPAAVRGGVVYVSSVTPFAFSAQDPGETASGVRETLVSLGTAPFLAATTAFALAEAEGETLIRFFSRDNVRNEEAVQSTTAFVDPTPPVLSIAVPTLVGESSQEVQLLYSDAGAGVALDSLFVALDGVAVSTQSEASSSSATVRVSAPNGRHALTATARDAVENVAQASATYRVDTLAPEVAVSVAAGTTTVRDGLLYVSTDRPLLTASATDGGLEAASFAFLLDGVAVAVTPQLTEANGDVIAASLSTVPAALAIGTHTVSFSATDLLGRVSSGSLTFLIDLAPPSVSLVSPQGGESFIARHSTIEVRFSVADDFDDRPSSTAFLVQLIDRGSPRGERPASVPVLDGQLLDPLSLDDGSWRLEVSAADLASNSTTTVGTPFEVVHDVRSPSTLLAVGQPQATGEPGGTLFVTSHTSMTLVSRDDLAAEGDGGGLGTARQLLLVDGAARAAFENPSPLPDAEFRSTFTLTGDSQGLRILSYSAVDVLGNAEPVRLSTVALDDTAPLTSLAVSGGRQATAGDPGAFYASTDTVYALLAVDPEVNGVAAGLETTFSKIEEAAPTMAASTFTLSEGRNDLAYWSRDRLGNLETTRSTAALVDGTPPVSAAMVGDPTFIGEGGVRYVSSSTLVALSAQDPTLPDGTAGSGLDRIEVALGDGPFASYASSLTFAEGRRLLRWRALDRVGNLEEARSLELRSDASAPETSLAVLGGRQAPGPDAGSFYASSDTRFALPAADPVVAEVTSGLDSTRWQDNGGPLQAYAAPLALSEGTHLLSYGSLDHVANAEVLRSTTVLIDATAPRSDFALGTPSFEDADGTRYISPATSVTFTAQDPALPGGTAGSGLARIEVSVDGADFVEYLAVLTFTEGRHLVSFRALDRVGNMEAAQTLALRSDASSPRTSLAIQGGRQVAGPDAASFYASLDTRFALPALDPMVAEVASGLESTSWQDNGGTFQTYGEPLALSEGAHLLAYRSRDRVQNLEVLRSTTALIDATPPVTAFQISSPSYTDATGVHYVTPTTPVTFSATDPALPGGAVGAGVERIEVAVDGGPFQAYSTALSFEQGRHTVLFRSVDRVGNVEAERALALRSDAVAPVTSLAVQGGKQAPGPDASSFYASLDTRLGLPAADPIVADVASGVDLTRWREGEGAFQTYSAPIALSEGSHLLAYQSLDRVANLEVLRSTTVLVDATAPRSSFTIGAPAFVAADGTRYVAPGTQVSFSAEDPTLPGGTAGSGVARIEVAVDGGQFATYSAALTFPEGRHTVQFRALDRVGNVEATQILALRADATPPLTTLSPNGAYYSAEGRDYAPANFTYALPAQDPVTADVASGVAETLYAVGTAAMQTFTAPFTLAEGIRVVTAQSRDNVANLEQPRASTVHVDASAPQTSLAVQGGRQAPGPNAGSFYASSDTRFAMAAVDPVVSGVASGVDFTRWQENSGAFAAFAAPIALGEGAHLLTYQTQDHVGNLEVLRSTTVFIDAAPPQTAFQIGSPAFVDPDGTRYVTQATPVSFSAQDAALPGGAAGSGVERIEVSVDGGPYATYSAALTLAEGRHVISFRSVDRVGNVEAAQTLPLRSDASAPMTSLAAQGGRQVAGPDANSNYASLDTRFALPAADPVVSDVAAGVAATRWQDNGGAVQAYGSPIALAEGSHLLAYQSQDKVQNLEVQRSTTILIDATAPLTAFNIGAPAYTDASGVHYVTPATPLTFTAQDPALPGGAAGSGVERIEVALDAAGFQTYSSALTFAEGRHSIRFRAYDKVGNVETERTLEVRSDASAPLSSLAVQGGRQTAGPDAASQYASADTRIALSASDPLVADVASGVELIRWQDNGGAFQTYSAPIALAEGRHILAYQGQDKVQNVETLRSTTVLVDATAPRTAFQIGTPAFIDPSGTRYLTPTTPVTFTAEDPALPGGAAGAGVERIEVAVDGGAFVTYSAALTFPEGRHTVQFRAADRVGNVEAAQTLALRSDASAPLTSLDIQGGRQAPGADATTFYASTATRYGLLAADPVVADVASGVEFTRWQDNGGSVMSYTGPIAFPEGVHILTYASEDRVDNVEAQKAVTAMVDATPPITQFSLNGPRYAHAAGDLSVGGELFVSRTTVIELTSMDPVANGVASGLDRLLASPDGGPFLPYAGAISFFPEGHHTVSYRGADRVGNEEGARSVSVAVDATAPSTMLTFDGPALVRGPGTTWEPQQAEAFITPVTKVILNTNDPTSAGIASGVRLTRFRIDSGPWQVYSGFFYLSNQGLHLVEFAAEDRVGNVETLVAKRIAVDNTAPLVSAAVNGSWLEAFGLNLLSTAATVSLAANDSSVAGVAVGMARILYRIDDGGLLEYTAPFAMGSGSHTVRYQAVDLLGNTGSPQTLSVWVLRFLGGSLAAKGAINGSGSGQFTGLLQTDAALSLTGNVSATGGADAFSISLKGNATLTGPTTQGVKPLSSDSIDLAAIQTALSAANDNAGLPPGSVSGGVLRVSGNQTVTLGTGSYLLSGLELSGNAKLLVSGPVRLFITGPVRLSGNAALNEAGPARNMAIFGTAASAQLSAAALSAVVYLPSASFEVSGNLRLGGSALAASVTLSGNSNATTPGLDAAAPAEVAAGGGQGGSKLASASADGGLLLASGPLDTTFVLRDIYAFPNPAVRGQRPVLHAAVGIADKVTIRLYDIAGQPVHAATIDSAPQVIDDGSGPKYAYEYVWDGHIPSGVYLYVVVAEKSGHAPIKRVGKLAVVR